MFKTTAAAVAIATISLGITAPAATYALGVAGPASSDEDWSRFRGPNGSGIADTSALPAEFGPDTNVVWKIDLPPGHSSPILSADRIYLTAHDGDDLYTIALERETGKEIWRRTAPRPRSEFLDYRNDPAAPSAAVADGEVYVFFGDYGLISYTTEGEERWSYELGPFNNIYGMGASPVLVDDKVILVCDQNVGSFMIALDRATGQVVWRAERPEAKSGHSTPILWQAPDGEDQLLVPGSFLLDAYDPDTGQKIWWVRGLSFEMKSTPVIHDGMAYINGYGSPLNQPGNQVELPRFEDIVGEHDADGDGAINAEEMPPSRASNWVGFVDLDGSGALDAAEWAYLRAALDSRNGMLAIRLGGEGDMTDSNIVWEYNRAVPQLPSPLVYNGILYMVNDGGIVTSFDPATGDVIAQGRLKGAVDQYYASPIAADGKIFMLSELGMLSVLEPDGGLAPVSVSDLDDLSYATPAIADGRVYVRTRNTLYAFGLDD